jgi:hypothetical protein
VKKKKMASGLSPFQGEEALHKETNRRTEGEKKEDH